MTPIDLVDWLRMFLILTTLFVFVVFGWRYIRMYKYLSRAQKLYIGAMLLFILSQGWRSVEAMMDNDGFKLALIPYIVGLILCFVYLAEPKDKFRSRLGRDVYASDMPPQILIERIESLEANNSELKDQIYALSRRCNDLKLALYAYTGVETEDE